jgi:hypothetical protein
MQSFLLLVLLVRPNVSVFVKSGEEDVGTCWSVCPVAGESKKGGAASSQVEERDCRYLCLHTAALLLVRPAGGVVSEGGNLVRPHLFR